MSRIAANLRAVQLRIKAAAERAGRNADEITLVAVTKTHPLPILVEAYRAGVRHFGENRVDEFQTKTAEFAAWQQEQGETEPARWHYIGHLQSRQVGPVIQKQPYLLHSVDSLKLAQRINRLGKRDNHSAVQALLQCNVSGESTKSGFDLSNQSAGSSQLDDFFRSLEKIAVLEKLNVVGLMTMAPYADDPEVSRPIFQKLAALRAKLIDRFPEFTWQHLSMGMTDDFEIGIEEGATMVRVGRAIFGERNYP